jgi:hypothetical protein
MRTSQVRSVTPLPERYSLVLRQSKYGPHPMVAFAHSARRVIIDGLAVGTTAVGSTILVGMRFGSKYLTLFVLEDPFPLQLRQQVLLNYHGRC